MNKYTYYGNGIMEVSVTSYKNQDLIEYEKISQKYAEMNIPIDLESSIVTQATKCILDFNELDGIKMFMNNVVDLGEDKIPTNCTVVEFGNELSITLVIDYEEFKKIFFEYKDSKNAS